MFYDYFTNNFVLLQLTSQEREEKKKPPRAPSVNFNFFPHILLYVFLHTSFIGLLTVLNAFFGVFIYLNNNFRVDLCYCSQVRN